MTQMKLQEFSIKDLENFSGVKAHTIRIWEQRYNLLAPDRSDTNIRKYSDKDLKLLLNVSLLNSLGYKISKIAEMDEKEINRIIAENTKSDKDENHLMHVLKIAMLNYDEALFNTVCEPYIQMHGLEKAYGELFIPFMMQIGFWWRSGAICPAQEHFISGLVRQKLYGELDKLPLPKANPDKKPFVLFLPELEIHELSLLMTHYAIKHAGLVSVFLGQSVPFEDLKEVFHRLGPAHFVTIVTTSPPALLMADYLKKITNAFRGTECHFHLTGFSLTGVKSPDIEVISVYENAEKMLNSLRQEFA
jgi:MerR family transcriptional regulator, light-induced transcriptional regulator